MGGKSEKIVREYEVTPDTRVVVVIIEKTDFLSRLRAVLGPTRRVDIPYRVHKGYESSIPIELRDHQRLKVL